MSRVMPFDARAYYYYYSAETRGCRKAGGLGGGFSPISLAPLALWLASISSGTVADLSGNGHDLTQATSDQRPTLASSPARLVFDGTDDNLHIPFAVCDALTGGAAVSLVLGYKGTALNSGIRLQPGAAGYIILGYDGGGGPEFAISADGGVGNGVSIAGVEDDVLHQIVGTWQRNTTNGFKVYIDGVLSAQKDAANVALPTHLDTTPAAIGAYLGGGAPAELITGAVTHAAVFETVLTAGNVASLYAWSLTLP